MKYYSETLKKLFESEEELLKAEKREEQLKEEENNRKETATAKKKEAATKVKIATDAYDIAAENFEQEKKAIEKIMDEARTEAAKIMAEAHEKCEKRLAISRDSLRKAKKEKIDAIEAFNKAYGPYKTVLTGEDAKKEFDRINSRFNDFDLWLNKLYKWL